MEEYSTKKDAQDIKDILVSMQGSQEANKKDIQSIAEVMRGYQEATKKDIQDILETMNAFASHTEEQFVEIKQETSGIKHEVCGINKDISGIKQEISGIKQDVTQIKATMVTKAYLDDKLADLRGDLTGYDRKQDKKVDFLTKTLENKKYLTPKEADAVVAMSPFPQAPKIV